MRHLMLKKIVAAIAVAAMLECADPAVADTFEVSGQTCSQNYAIYDYYSNGEYVTSAWEADGLSCMPNDGGSSYSPYSDPGGGGGGGGGDGGLSPATTACRATDQATVQTYSDALAVDAADAIKSHSDYTRHEYGALVHRDAGGSLRLTPLVPGTATSVPFDFTQLGVNASQIVGLIHNHPREVYNTSPQELQINLNPSSNDWANATMIVNAGANADLLKLYVVGTDGVLRQFDYNNRASYEPHQSITQGYHVTPGETVPTDLVAPACP